MIEHPPTHSDVVDGVYYPCSDGQPMAETPIHAQAMFLLYQALGDVFASRPTGYVGIDMFWYWEKGNPAATRAPNVFVVLGVSKRQRRSFKSFEDGGARPAVIFEMASENTWRVNLNETKNLYEQLGVIEYLVFDPTRDYLPEPLLGFRLDSNHLYQAVEADADGGMTSTQLGLRFVPEGEMLRVIAANGQPILTHAERAEQQRQRADQQEQRAEQERQRAEQERQRAEQERQRADAAEAEIARLRALLGQPGPSRSNGPSPPAAD